jgi:hypothetical protein
MKKRLTVELPATADIKIDSSMCCPQKFTKTKFMPEATMPATRRVLVIGVLIPFLSRPHPRHEPSGSQIFHINNSSL